MATHTFPISINYKVRLRNLVTIPKYMSQRRKAHFRLATEPEKRSAALQLLLDPFEATTSEDRRRKGGEAPKTRPPGDGLRNRFAATRPAEALD